MQVVAFGSVDHPIGLLAHLVSFVESFHRVHLLPGMRSRSRSIRSLGSSPGLESEHGEQE